MALISLGCESGIHFSEGARHAIDAPQIDSPVHEGHGYLTLELVWQSITEGECLKIGSGTTNPETTTLMTRAERSLTRIALNELPSPVHRLAYWINAHNFAVLYALETQERVSGRTDLTQGGFALLRAPKLAFGGVKLAPDWIAHGIVRGDFEHIGLADADETTLALIRTEHEKIAGLVDGRVLLALACGARSCPAPLSYRPDRLDQQLDAAAKRFIADPRIGTAEDGISALFHWYAQDFASAGGIPAFISRYGSNEAANLQGMLPFDWSIRQYDPSDDRCATPDENGAPNPSPEDTEPQPSIPGGSDVECEAGQTRPCGPSAARTVSTGPGIM